MKKLNSILLIDNDKPTNFLHKMIIFNSGYTKECLAFQSGQDALDYLGTKEKGEYPCPELIFLDINIPGMDGWEFLKAYQQLEIDQQKKAEVIMLTTSVDPVDEAMASANTSVINILKKPLTTELISEIIQEHFPEHV